MSRLEAEFAGPVTRLLDAYAPEPESEGDWQEVVRRTGIPTAATSSSKASARRGRLLILAALVIAVLAGPTYGIGRAFISGWLSGEPAPQSVIDNFTSYAPQLGFQPEPGKAVLVASDRGFSLYATPNDRASYCVATSTPDGGICIQPSTASAPLIAGIMPGDPTRIDARGTTLVAGRVDAPGAVAITFTDPDGAVITRPLGSSGFFLAALSAGEAESGTRPYPCKNGDWAPTFRALSATGEEVASAQITLARAPSASGVLCGWANGPHR
jgi:hypothetical protein